MNWEATYATHQGSRHSANQDALALGQDVPVEVQAQRGRLFVVADGYGKDAAGSAASRAAVQALTRAFYDSHEADTGTALVKAVQLANDAVRKAAGQPGSGGSTLTAVVVRGNSLHIVHVGDSRAYLLRASQLRRLTHDHTWGAEQLRSGQLRPEQVAQDPKRGQLTRALGLHGSLPKEQVEHRAETMEAGDVLLLCSDGLSDVVAETDLATALGQAQAAEHLLALAGQRGATDDVSVVVVQSGSAQAIPAKIVLPLAVAAGVILFVLLAVWLRPRDSSPSPPTAIARTGTALAAQVTAAAQTGTPAAAAAQPGGAATSTLAPTQAGGALVPQRTFAPTPPGATVTPLPQYPAPTLTGPEDNAEFRGRETPIRLQWRSVGALAADDVYVVTIDFPHNGAIWHDAQTTTATEVVVPTHVYDGLGGDRRLTWRVAVWRQPLIQDGLPVGARLGEESAPRVFVWQPVESGLGISPTPPATATPSFDG